MKLRVTPLSGLYRRILMSSFLCRDFPLTSTATNIILPFGPAPRGLLTHLPRRSPVHVDCAREFHAVDGQIIAPKREIPGKQILRTDARLLAIGRRQTWCRTI